MLQRTVCYTLITVKEKSRGSEPSDNDGRGLSCEVATSDGTDQTSRSYMRISAEQRGWTGNKPQRKRLKRKFLNFFKKNI